MRKKILKTVFYALIAFFSLVMAVLYSSQKTNENFLETSVLTIIKAINQDLGSDELPDLAIEKVDLKKISDPSKDFNYYKYSADITVKNYGGTLVDGTLVIYGSGNQKHSYVKNTKNGFYLQKYGTYAIRDYQILFDGNFNGGRVNLTIELKGKEDKDISNNTYIANVLSLPAKIKNISLSEINKDKSFTLDFEKNDIYQNLVFELYTSKNYSTPEDELKYAEVSGFGDVYSYYKLQNSAGAVNGDWLKIVPLNNDFFTVKFSENPFKDNEEHYLFIKAYDPENGNYIVSNIIKFPRYQALTRGEFAKYFVEKTGETIVNDGVVYYQDAGINEIYSPQIQTLYNLGLTDSNVKNFMPEKIMTRGEALKIILNYYQTNLRTTETNSHFKDIEYNSLLFPYAEALYKKGVWVVIGYYLHPDAPATKDFVKYLLNAYRENY